ncbi:nuclear transport factor 2 family protein [Saccharopolyspora sp. ASAGF58]|uniref:nuclear transport factor 2 family protein n=1 Tax=Saccharopolyspora sp. ASAGF58 TaxID=2719023 RepID=UPI00143FEDB5|nr:nuclear transport factor 2 family protein [Saccharopolyspora sp. ASAGF58]QIZ38012.1 nuclear transport factor 2 family protein [Saccharopolyspora sp. ASAGF58]
MSYDNDALARLESRIEIEELKARYFRYLDTKNWTGLRSVYTDDATFTARGVVHRGADAVVAFIESQLRPDVTSIHHGHMPEIEITNDRATAIWAMEDTINRPDGTGFHGCGHYHDRYERTADGWKIAESTLSRLVFEPAAGRLADDERRPPELANRATPA